MEYENCISETSREVNKDKSSYNNLDSSCPKNKKDFELHQESRFQGICCKMKLEPPSPMKPDKSVVPEVTNNSVGSELLAKEGCEVGGGKGGSDISLSVVKRNNKTSSPVPSFIVLYDDPLSALKENIDITKEKDVTINTDLPMSTQDEKGSARRIKILNAEKEKRIWNEGCLFYKKKCVDELECYDTNLVFKSIENSPSVNLGRIVKNKKGNIQANSIFFTLNGIDAENVQAIKPIIDPIEHEFFDSIEQNLNNSRDSLQKGCSWGDSYTSVNSQEYSYCDARANVVLSSPLPEPNWSVWKTPPELRVHPHSQTKQVNQVNADSRPKRKSSDFLKQKFNILATKGKSVAARYGLVNSNTESEETMGSNDSSVDSEILGDTEQHSWSYVSFKENVDYESGLENVADSGSLNEFDLFDFFDVPEVVDEIVEKSTLDYSSVSVKCEIRRCKWKGFCYELCSHVLANHNDSDIMSDVNQVKKVYNATQLLITKKKASLTSLAIDKGELFWFTFATRPRLQKCYFIARLIGEQSKAERYSVDVFLKRVLNSSVQQYSCPMGCVRDTIRQLIKSEYCIAIPQKQMAMFTDNYSHEILFQLSIEEG